MVSYAGSMKPFQEDESWLESGLHLLTMILIGLGWSSLVTWLYSTDFGKWVIISIFGVVAGLWLGDSIFSRVRDRYRRRQGRSVP